MHRWLILRDGEDTRVRQKLRHPRSRVLQFPNVSLTPASLLRKFFRTCGKINLAFAAARH